MIKQIRTLTLQFDTEIESKEIPLFRGAVLNSLGDQANVLYHNHTDENSFRYSYPLIQYKRLEKKAAIVCIGDGIEALNDFRSFGSHHFMIGDKEMEMHIESVHAFNNDIFIDEHPKSYRLVNWLPLNSKNYQQFQNTESLIEKISILENVLVGNILSFLKGMDIHLEKRLDLHITDIKNQRLMAYKDVKLMAFNIDFKANITLPQHIGIGKNASVGYGVLFFA